MTEPALSRFFCDCQFYCASRHAFPQTEYTLLSRFAFLSAATRLIPADPRPGLLVVIFHNHYDWPQLDTNKAIHG